MLALAFGAAPATAAPPRDGAERVTYRVGPLQITPGQNRVAFRTILEKPDVDGWIVRFKPNLVRADGSVPRTDHVMFHHGVWINSSRPSATNGLPELAFAVGEEKTTMEMPLGFGYRYDADDRWILNHMVHNLTSQAMTLYVTYTIDFIPADSPAAAGIREVRPIWMDVMSGDLYPVFDVHKGSAADGRFRYPNDDPDAYPSGRHRNMWQVDHDGVLIGTAGHVHTGGLSTDLWLRRTGARYAGPRCARLPTAAQRRRCRSRSPSVSGNRVHLFRSKAVYWEPAGPVSWDVSMTATPPNWRVAVKAGDMMEITTDYETKRASWYESMGINVVWMADGGGGKNPYRQKVDWPGRVTHGHLPENNVHGGAPSTMPDPRRLANGISTSDPLAINGFVYEAGDLRLPGTSGRPPVVKRGRSLTFELGQQDASQEIWHSLTSCAPPCNGKTGIAYPIPDGRFQFDSGQMGTVQPPTVGRTTWNTPKNLPAGTYTYFCRIHPDMRGAFRVTR
jgi:hypothetical protein